MWWFSRCLFTVKPFLSNEILCLTLIHEGDKLADPGPQPLLPMVPGCLRHIWLVGAGGGQGGTWFQSPGLNTGWGESASLATKTFLSLLFSGLEFPLQWNDGFAQTSPRSFLNGSQQLRVTLRGRWGSGSRRPGTRRNRPVLTWRLFSSRQGKLGNQNQFLCRMVSEENMFLRLQWGLCHHPLYRRTLWRKGFEPVVSCCSSLIVVIFVGKWLAMKEEKFSH